VQERYSNKRREFVSARMVQQRVAHLRACHVAWWNTTLAKDRRQLGLPQEA
jgi:hypothetical protein